MTTWFDEWKTLILKIVTMWSDTVEERPRSKPGR